MKREERDDPAESLSEGPEHALDLVLVRPVRRKVEPRKEDEVAVNRGLANIHNHRAGKREGEGERRGADLRTRILPRW